MKTISETELIKLWVDGNISEYACFDVRSEKEAEQGALPYFVNTPILRNSQRAQVGCCYKRNGREDAIALGYRLTTDYRDELLDRWATLLGHSPCGQSLVHCWRGGLRSKIASEWICAAGGDAAVVSGGYKAVRRVLRRELESTKPMLVLSGLSGTAKTELLQRFSAHSIDLEALARHRGSAFGLRLGDKQPRQQNFEHSLALDMAKRRGLTLLFEDESKLIGQCFLGSCLYAQMTSAPHVVLESPFCERVSHIVTEYVHEPLDKGFAVERVRAHLRQGLDRLQRSLGNLLHGKLVELLLAIKVSDFSRTEAHAPWVASLLESYYDKAYQYSFARRNKKVVFRGNLKACQEFLTHRLGLPASSARDEAGI